MSWPKDGRPRYVVTELRGGIGITQGGLARKTAPDEYYVLDRAYCHRIVARYSNRLAHHAGYAAKQARERAAMLNDVERSLA